MRTAIVYEGTQGSPARPWPGSSLPKPPCTAPVIVGEAHEIPLAELEGVEFLVVGGPTPPWEDWANVPARTQSAAHVLRDLRPPTDGVRGWLDQLPPRPSFSAATFRHPGAGSARSQWGPPPSPSTAPSAAGAATWSHGRLELPRQARSGLRADGRRAGAGKQLAGAGLPPGGASPPGARRLSPARGLRGIRARIVQIDNGRSRRRC